MELAFGSLGKQGKILVVEDDHEASLEMQEVLEGEGFDVTCVSNAQELLSFGSLEDVDVFLIDLGLPDVNGLDLVKSIKSSSTSGIIIVSGKSDSVDKVVGLQLGADDYVGKPFDPRELSARVFSLVRRIKDLKDSKKIEEQTGLAGEDLVFSRFVVKVGNQSLVALDGTKQELTTSEFNVLLLLASSPNRVFSRDQLITHLKGQNWAGYDRAVDGLISRLRKKLSVYESTDAFIKTVHGSGYMFVKNN